MERLDRSLQIGILQFLRRSYPAHAVQMKQQDFSCHPDFLANFWYLKDHGLVDCVTNKASGPYEPLNPKITVKGLDFLEDDGGLDAILKTVTVKFDAETIRSLLSDKVVHLNLPEPEKETALTKLKTLPADALRRLALKLVEKAAENGADLIRLLQSLGAS